MSTLKEFEKARTEGEIHPNGRWVWRSSANNGKGDWRTLKNKDNNSESSNKSSGEILKKQNKSIEDYAQETSTEKLKSVIKNEKIPNKIKVVAEKELKNRGENIDINIENKDVKEDFINVSKDMDAMKKLYNKDKSLKIDLGKIYFGKGLFNYEHKFEPLVYKQLDSLDSYLHNSRGGYKDIRYFLSHDEKENSKYFGDSWDFFKKEIPKTVENISNFIKQNKIKNSIVVNRVINIQDESLSNFFTSLKVGDVYQDESFVSVTLENPEKLSEYLFRKKRERGEEIKEFYIEILAKKEKNIANALNDQEHEYLIDKGSRFKVLEVENNKIKVELL